MVRVPPDGLPLLRMSRPVERLRPGRTVLLIAHRPELVAHADRVVLLGGDAAVREEAA